MFCTGFFFFFFFNDTATTEIYTLSLHDALPISRYRVAGRAEDPRPHREHTERGSRRRDRGAAARLRHTQRVRSEEHTSELQSPCNLVCRLLLEKKKKTI